MNEPMRADPEALLSIARKAERAGLRGRLKVFLGMCPGVGKTYAMLLAAQQRQEEGADVMIGWIETHGRIETQALTAGLARIARRVVQHRSTTLEEMDLDAILARKPALVLVDELAHSNVAGGRHPKRYQDVAELIEAGIDVYTTLNIQHIESLRDVVTQITGAPVHESVPDSVLDEADEIELIDIPPAQLRKRLEEGKVYLGDRAVNAADNFFREGNLKALREIALRITAEHAESELREFMQTRRIPGPWKSRERLLVAVGPSPFSEKLIRWTRRMTTLSHAAWMAVYIDTGRTLDDTERARLEKNLTLARALGAEVLTASGGDVTEILLRVAREQNATQIVVGKPLSNAFLDFLKGGSLVDKLIRRSGDIDISVVRAEKSGEQWKPDLRGPGSGVLLKETGIGLGIVLGTTLVGLLLKPVIGYMAVGLLYLLAVLFGSLVLSLWPILLTGALTALVWNYLFLAPVYTFEIRSIHDAILFGLYFIVALVVGNLTARLREREKVERRREAQATALYHFSRGIVNACSHAAALAEGVRHIDELFGVRSSILAADGSGKLVILAGQQISAREMAVAAWAFEKGEPAGKFTSTLPEAKGSYIPLRTGSRAEGALGFETKAALTLAERQLLETFAAQIALVIERDRLTREAETSRLEEKSRRLQKTLLDSVSHEFRTPLAVISTATERLQAEHPNALAAEIQIAADRLRRIVASLLDITRIETGTVRPKLEWCVLEDVVAEAMEEIPKPHAISATIDPIVSACRVDASILREMLVNLLRNAVQYSAPNSPIEILAHHSERGLIIRVRDEGLGIPPDEIPHLFEKFSRGVEAKPGGLGLGLSIVRGFAEAHGGSASAKNREDGTSGAEFQIRLPVETKTAEMITP